jgi:hypothetical protein
LKIVLKKPTKDNKHYEILKTTNPLKDSKDDGIAPENNEDKDVEVTIMEKNDDVKTISDQSASSQDDDTEMTSKSEVKTARNQDNSHVVEKCIELRRFLYSDEACLKCLRELRKKLQPFRLLGVSCLFKITIITHYFKFIDYSFYNCRLTLRAMVVAKITSWITRLKRCLILSTVLNVVAMYFVRSVVYKTVEKKYIIVNFVPNPC